MMKKREPVRVFLWGASGGCFRKAFVFSVVLVGLLQVSFAWGAPHKVTVVLNPPDGGTVKYGVSFVDSGGFVLVPSGGDALFTVKPGPGKEIRLVGVGTVAGGTLSPLSPKGGTSWDYEIKNVVEPMNMQVVFRPSPGVVPTLTVTPPPPTNGPVVPTPSSGPSLGPPVPSSKPSPQGPSQGSGGCALGFSLGGLILLGLPLFRVKK